ncbi:MAG: hypothetical protein ABR498_04735 [Candidatus Dormibacteria bacterium]
MKPNAAAAIALVVLAVVFAALAVFYFTTKTSLLASDTGIHYKHASLFAALAVLALVAANFARRGTASRGVR